MLHFGLCVFKKTVSSLLLWLPFVTCAASSQMTNSIFSEKDMRAAGKAMSCFAYEMAWLLGRPERTVIFTGKDEGWVYYLRHGTLIINLRSGKITGGKLNIRSIAVIVD